MRSTKYHNLPQQPAQARSDHPLAQSAFNGEDRLRELEQLAQTARKVRDQAAAELTRNGSAHHIARDRIAAAERMLQKTQSEIQALRTQLGLTSAPPAKPDAQAQTAVDFELAMLLGNSSKRLNRDELGPDTFTIEINDPPKAKPQTAKSRAGGKPTTRQSAGQRRPHDARSIPRLFGLGLVVLLGVGLGAAGTYLVITSDSLADAAHRARAIGTDLTQAVLSHLPGQPVAPGSVGPDSGLEVTQAPATLQRIPPAAEPQPTVRKPVKLDPFQKRAQEEQAERLRKAAAERLKNAIAQDTKASHAASQPVPLGSSIDDEATVRASVPAPAAAQPREQVTDATATAPRAPMTVPSYPTELPLDHPEPFE